MANEIKVEASLSFAKGGAASGMRAVGTFTFTGTVYDKYETTVTTSEAALKIIGSGGWCMVRNLDATNYVQLLRATGEAAFARIKAGEFSLFRLDAGVTAPRIIANTASVAIEVLILDN